MFVTTATVRLLPQNLNLIVGRDLKVYKAQSPLDRWKIWCSEGLSKCIQLHFRCIGQLSEWCSPNDRKLQAGMPVFFLPSCFPAVLSLSFLNSNLKKNIWFWLFCFGRNMQIFSYVDIFGSFFSKTHPVILILPLKYLWTVCWSSWVFPCPRSTLNISPLICFSFFFFFQPGGLGPLDP